LVDGTITVVADVTDQAGNPASDTESAVLQPPASLQVGNNDDNEIVGDGGDDVLIGDRGGKETIIDPAANYNISLIVDVSGSMAWDVNGNRIPDGSTTQSRLELTKQALINLADQLKDHEGMINIQLVAFASSASTPLTIQGLNAGNVQQLIDEINGLQASGVTNYEAAFGQSVSWFNDQTSLQQVGGIEFEDLTYFLTDGDPTAYTGRDGQVVSNGFVTAEVFETSVTAFDGLSNISEVNAIGIGSGVSENYLRFFDNTEVQGTGEESFVVGREYVGFWPFGRWEDTVKTVSGSVGDVNIVNTAQDLAAALDGSSEFDQLAGLGDDRLIGGAGNDIIFADSINTDHLEWTNEDTGVFFAEGSHDGLGYQGLREYLKWEVNDGSVAEDSQILDYVRDNFESLIDTTRIDGGDDYLDGGVGEDILIGGAGEDTLIGGAGNDILFGGEGEDTFKWELNDQGSTGQPATDTVMDFNASEGDVLDISELLQNEENVADLSTYIVAEEEGADTVLYISSDGNLAGNKENADQVVRLEGKSFSDFGGGSAQDVIQHMLNNDQLKIDQ
ncbi:type I secretion C-terminal target domain-containing protein, partial [Halomonas sp. SIMBA_159]